MNNNALTRLKVTHKVYKDFNIFRIPTLRPLINRIASVSWFLTENLLISYTINAFMLFYIISILQPIRLIMMMSAPAAMR